MNGRRITEIPTHENEDMEVILYNQYAYVLHCNKLQIPVTAIEDKFARWDTRNCGTTGFRHQRPEAKPLEVQSHQRSFRCRPGQVCIGRGIQSR